MFYVSIDVSTTFHGKVAVGEFVETLSLVLFFFQQGGQICHTCIQLDNRIRELKCR